MAFFASLSRYEPQLLALLRIVAGLLYLAHALVKLSGFPPGAEPGQVPLTSLFGVAALIEVVLSPLIIVGVFTRPVAFLAAGEMAIAYWWVHAPSSIYPSVNHGEVAILFCFVFLYIAASGPGAWSVDGRGRAGRVK
jgi:putative oxidoreductase